MLRGQESMIVSGELLRPGSALGKVIIIITAWSQAGKAMDWRRHETGRGTGPLLKFHFSPGWYGSVD